MQNDFDRLNEIFGVSGSGSGADGDVRNVNGGTEPPAVPAQEDGYGLPDGPEREQLTEDAYPAQEEPGEPAPEGAEEDSGASAEYPEADAGDGEEEYSDTEADESERRAMGLLRKLDSMIYDPEKHEQRAEERKKRRAERRRAEEEDDELEERDFRPIRQRRDGKIGCMGGIMYFAFVISVSVILAALGWMAAMDVLALNKPELTAVITLPDEIFSEVEVEITDSDGNVTGTRTDLAADIDYVADVLKSAGLIEYKPLFKFFCRISNAATDIDPGTYELNTTYDYNALVLRMREASAIQVTVELMFPEGSTMAEIFERLEENGVSTVEELEDAAANYVFNYSFLDPTLGDAQRMEGYLFPDTYQFYQDEQASSVINKFLQNFNTRITTDMLNQADNRGMELRDVITVASMIEAEAANDEERPVIASVIYNRLNAGMPLQIDATVMYALGEHKEYLTVEDTQVQSPYNTYLNTGLPAGPICNPGLSSINAALNPGQTDYLYYALDTESGTHRFFSSYEEFEAFTATQDYTGATVNE